MGELLFLGTGDPFNYERTQTALAVPLPGGETLLIDTASGTDLLGQLDRAGIALAGIRHLIMTHRHFDHAGGLAPLLVDLVAVPGAAITVYATAETGRALHDLLRITIPGVEDWLGPRLHWKVIKPERPLALGDLEITPFDVEHGIECVGLRVARDGRTAVFSADTCPCPNLVRHARGADLLIHEVYSLDAQAEDAHRFGHSTAADAGAAARDAAVAGLVLTHFRSPKYVAVEDLRAEAAAIYPGPVTPAEDLLRVAF